LFITLSILEHVFKIIKKYLDEILLCFLMQQYSLIFTMILIKIISFILYD
jgi:hypothetical protein